MVVPSPNTSHKYYWLKYSNCQRQLASSFSTEIVWILKRGIFFHYKSNNYDQLWMDGLYLWKINCLVFNRFTTYTLDIRIFWFCCLSFHHTKWSFMQGKFCEILFCFLCLQSLMENMQTLPSQYSTLCIQQHLWPGL